MSDSVMTADAFRAEAQRFLDANAPRRRTTTTRCGEGSDRLALFRENTADEDAAEVAAAKRWRAAVADAGFGWISGPPEYGGRGLPRAYERIWQQLVAGYDIPGQTCFSVSLGMVAPTILAHGQEEAKRRYLRALYRGDEIGCQLFSEPGAGSDLAGVGTRAVRAGDQWVVTGQKVWTSGAHYSDVGELLARTAVDPDSRHRGLTMLLVDMHADGVEVRPLRQMTGGASFNEVFLTEVRVTDSMRLGEVDSGWPVALTTLMNERNSIGSGGNSGHGVMRRLLELAREIGRNDDPCIRQVLADLFIHTRVASYTAQRLGARRGTGQTPGPEMSIGKLATTQNLQRVVAAATALAGPSLVADSGAWGRYAWSEYILGAPGLRIAGGTDEIMRTILGEHVLGLPK